MIWFPLNLIALRSQYPQERSSAKAVNFGASVLSKGTGEDREKPVANGCKDGFLIQFPVYKYKYIYIYLNLWLDIKFPMHPVILSDDWWLQSSPKGMVFRVPLPFSEGDWICREKTSDAETKVPKSLLNVGDRYQRTPRHQSNWGGLKRPFLGGLN